MCGVCGIMAFSDAFVSDEQLVVEMRDTMPRSGRGKYRFLDQKLATPFSEGR